MSQRAWNHAVKDFVNSVCDIASEETNDRLRHLVKAVRPSPERSVLVDLGCGRGTFVRKFGHQFRDIIATDFASNVVKQAKAVYRGKKPVNWGVLDAALAGKQLGTCADLTVCMNVITSDQAAVRRAIWSSLKTVTKPKGHMLVVVPAIESYHMVAEWTPHEDVSAFKRGGIVERDGFWQKHYSRDELAALVKKLGFTVVRLEGITYPWSSEGLRKPRGVNKAPFDWIVLARRKAR